MISLRQIRFSYSDEEEILSGVDLTVSPGEKLVVSGRSGSGKSTLLKLITGLLTPTSGKIILSHENASIFGYVKQQPENQVITGSVEEEVTFGLLCKGLKKNETGEKVKKALSDVGLSGMEKRSSSRLSGGQLQRLVFAASHVLEPDIWILDEPTAYLDRDGKTQIYDLINSLPQDKSVIFVTSDPEEYALFDRLVLLHEKRIVADESPETIFKNNVLKRIGLEKPIHQKLEEFEIEYSSIMLENKKSDKEKIAPELRANALNVSRKQLFQKPIKVLHDLNFKLEPGEALALVGRSGAGKTSLIETLAGVLKPDDGDVFWDSSRPSSLYGEIGVSFQFPERSFFAETVLDEITYGIINQGTGKKEAEEIALVAMEKFKLNPSVYKDRSPFEISGGQARRVALAATWALRPNVYLMDEPTVGLDAKNKKLIQSIFSEEKKRGCTIILAGHDLESFMTIANRWLVLEKGQIVYDGDVNGLWKENQKKDVISPPVIVDEIRKRKGMLEEARRLGWSPVITYLSRR